MSLIRRIFSRGDEDAEAQLEADLNELVRQDRIVTNGERYWSSTCRACGGRMVVLSDRVQCESCGTWYQA